MAEQLHREALLAKLDAEESIEGDEFKALSFSRQLDWFLEGVRTGDKTSVKPLLIILDEFDLFAMHRNQLLLYNLFDACQNGSTPLCVIGLTCRLDVMELLEKRVKSRFSHRQIFLQSIAAPIDSFSSYADPDHPSEQSNSASFNNYLALCKAFLSIDATDCRRHQIDSSKAVERWNEHIDRLLTDEVVIDSLRQAWSISVDIRRLKNILVG